LPLQTRKTDWYVQNKTGSVKWLADADEFRRIMSISAMLGTLLPKMPEKFVPMERFVKYFSNKIGYANIFVREGVYILAACDLVSIQQMGAIKAVSANGQEGINALKARADWVMALSDEEVKKWAEGGLSVQKRHIFYDIQIWKQERDAKNRWDNEINKFFLKVKENGTKDDSND
jgi:hypothetical protein